MELIPAIDIKNGKCVRLQQGREDRVKRYSDSPLDVAQRFVDAGVRKIHLVDLDGALRGKSPNIEILGKIIRCTPLEVELGGGIRSLKQIERWLDLGVGQVVLGSLAVEKPEETATAIQRFGKHQIIFALDTRSGRIAYRGWRIFVEMDPVEWARQMCAIGASRFIYTDIQTDGMMTGPNMTALRAFATNVDVPVTASGGIRHLEDIRSLQKLESVGVDSVIVGKAVYEGKMDVFETVRFCRRNQEAC
jgi:phosphoribosylformimino-5-aminoimidazole carboxamide ribotide isomerase